MRSHKEDDATCWLEVNSSLRKRSGTMVDSRMWIIERERGRVSETTWLLLTNAIWPTSLSNGRFRSAVCSPRVCGKKRRKESGNNRPVESNGCQKVMRYQFLCRINIYSAIKLFASRFGVVENWLSLSLFSFYFLEIY